MKKLRSILVLFLLFSTMFMVNENVDASAGRLKSGSITTCNGTTYGEHAGHWHYAQKRGSFYYASGSPVSKPCAKAKKKKSSSYSSGYSAKKAVAKNKVTSDKDSTKDDTDKETEDVDTLKEDDSTTPEVSNFTDSEEKSKDTDKDSDPMYTFASALGGILIIGFGGSHLVRKRRNKKKKDDLTNW